MIEEKIIRLVAGITAFFWSILHLDVGYNAAIIAASTVGHKSLIFAIYSEYFGFNAALYIFAGYEIITFTRKLLLPFFLLFLWNTALVIYTHVFASPFLGKPLPIIPQVYPAILLDIILLTTVSILLVRNIVGQ
jgi:hypothetical protein